MPALCAPLGPMLCLNGATCNSTTGLCDNCPVGFRNDETLFRGNVNCGLDLAGIYFVYIFTALLSLFVMVLAMTTAMRKKKSRMRNLLFLICTWNLVIIFLLLAHYLDGFRFGVASVILLFLVLGLVNTQVFAFEYSIASFLAIINNNPNSNQQIYQFQLRWYLFWMSIKFICFVLSEISLGVDNLNMFNIVMLVTGVSLFIEVSLNVFIGYRRNTNFVLGMKALQSNVTSTTKISNTPALIELSQKLEKSRLITVAYGILIFSIGALIPILFGVFDSSVPYSVFFFSLIVISWPFLGIQVILVLQSSYGKRLIATDGEKQTLGSSTMGKQVEKKSIVMDLPSQSGGKEVTSYEHL